MVRGITLVSSVAYSDFIGQKKASSNNDFHRGFILPSSIAFNSNENSALWSNRHLENRAAGFDALLVLIAVSQLQPASDQDLDLVAIEAEDGTSGTNVFAFI